MLSFLIDWVGCSHLPLEAKNMRYWKGDKSDILRLAGLKASNNIKFVDQKTP